MKKFFALLMLFGALSLGCQPAADTTDTTPDTTPPETVVPDETMDDETATDTTTADDEVLDETDATE